MTIISRVALAATILLAATLPSPAQEVAREPLATGCASSGSAIAEVSDAIRDGDRLTVKVRFKSADDENYGAEQLYAVITDQTYEQGIYLVAGDKKDLLIKDSEGVPLAPASLNLRDGGPFRGMWSGVFPAPPAGQKVTLFLPDVEPLGPFALPAE